MANEKKIFSISCYAAARHPVGMFHPVENCNTSLHPDFYTGLQ
jgi:hypothetical protein